MKIGMGEYFNKNGDDGLLARSVFDCGQSSTKDGSLYRELSLGLKLIDRLNYIFDTATFCDEYVNVNMYSRSLGGHNMLLL